MKREVQQSQQLTRKEKRSAIVMKAIQVLTVIMVTVLLSGNKANAQYSLDVTSLAKDSVSTKWHTLKSVGLVNIQYQLVDCGPVEFVFIKIENTGSQKMNVSWKYQHLNNGADLNISADDANVSIDVDGNASVNGACSSDYIKLGVFIKEESTINKVSLIKFLNLTAVPAQ